MRLAPGDAIGLATALIQVDSRNPSIDPDGPGEGAVAQLLAGVLESWGFAVEMQDVRPGRPNVIARIGSPGTRSLMLNGHLDVVGISGMRHPPWHARHSAGLIYGRGAADMKGGIASMCAAASRSNALAQGGEIIIAAVVDEEYESLGTRALLERGIRADAAIVTEPTDLAIMPAHRGFVWLDVTVHGRAAHGSRWDIGVDAIRDAGLLLAELDAFDETTLTQRQHSLLGRPSLHASFINGGTGMSTYPDRCELKLERRTIPGEDHQTVLAEVESACARLGGRRPTFRADVSMTLAQAPSDVNTNAPIVQALAAALEANQIAPRVEGMSAWTDAALLNEAGVPAICFGPGDLSLAHAAEEFIRADDIERATGVLTKLASTWCGTERAPWPA